MFYFLKNIHPNKRSTKKTGKKRQRLRGLGRFFDVLPMEGDGLGGEGHLL